MEKVLSSFDVHFLVKEIQFLLDSKVDQVYGNNDFVLLSLHKTDIGKVFFKIKNEIVCLSKEKSIQNELPSFFCTLLRKNIVNYRIKSITQVNMERIIDIELCFKEECFHLIIELFGGGNVLLIKDNYIVCIKTKKVSSERNVSQKEKYEFPNSKINIKLASEQDVKNILLNSDKENIVKTLAIDFFMGGLYAEEVLYISNIDKSQKSKNIDPKNIYSAIQLILNKKLKPNIVKDLILPIEFNHLKGEMVFCDSFCVALSENDSNVQKKQKKSEIKTIFDKKIKKQNSIIFSQNKQIESMKKDSDKNKEKAELIMKNYEFVESEINSSKEDKIKLNLN